MISKDLHHFKSSLPVFSLLLDDGDLNLYLKSLILEYRKEHPTSYNSNVKAWHTDFKLNQVPEFKPIIDLTLQACRDISIEYFDNEVNFYSENMWAMMYDRGDHTIEHAHWPSDFATTYYVDVEDGSSPIMFGKDSITPRSGMLLLWPGIMKHSVPSTDSKRMVIGHNLNKLSLNN